MTTILLRRLVAALCSLASQAALAHQLSPDREFYGVGRPVPMTVALPHESPPATQPGPGQAQPAPAAPAPPAPPAPPGPTPNCTVAIFSAAGDKPLAVSTVLPGKIDLAALLPTLWEDRRREVLFAQLSVNDAPVGPPVVLMPMLNQPRAKAKAVAGAERPVISFEPLEGEEDVYSGVQAWSDQRVVLTTDQGEIEVATRPDAAPLTARNFLRLVAGGLYDCTGFHRVVPLTADGKPFVIQGGDPTGTGSGGCGSYLDLENSRLPHDLGVVSMARADDPDTAGSQFFVCLSREGTARLDGSYAAFGVVTRGIET
ncbi:MAG: peptidylprolyl isomerase, partial [Phycisphaerales bacterium]|nr:peptidylprolyl isomerase [Phycisphaerales bacterium]